MLPNRRGLSLVEVLIVVMLIAVMMVMSLPMLGIANAKARSELCQQNLVDIGQAVVTFSQDTGKLPAIQPIPPHHDGQSLSEFVSNRLRTPLVVYCPSDETDLSQRLGTSYKWSIGFNALPTEQLPNMVGKPLLLDRESYHTNADLPVNELVLSQDEAGYRLALQGQTTAEMTPAKQKRDLHFKHRPDKDKMTPPGQAHIKKVNEERH